MNHVIKAEFRRLTATRMWLWALVAAVGFGGGLVGLLTAVGPENFDPPMPALESQEGVRSLLGVLGFTVFVPAALGTLAVTSEYRHRTATFTFLFTPRRWQVLAGKLVTFTAGGMVYGLVLTGTAALGLFGAAAARGATVGMDTAEVLLLLLRLAVTMAVYTLLGVGLGALIRNQIVALAVVVGYLYMGELILLMIPGVNIVYPLLPGGATASLTSFTYIADALAEKMSTDAASLLSPVGGGLLLAGYALVAAVLAVLVPMRRDVN
ncbi:MULTISPECIES: ABC transporter permease [Streptomyces]|uniref:ABC transporter permease n=1 Tax=Streptomyces cacaoi TaxID=1898 RepID=A0A4Y3R7M9_STRCI|nr:MULTISPECIES: ABC transporter permease [Streptomyces]NNG83693.1 ABC transporter permease [Streptomyces cacaoi]QHF96052.1 ABC transporter permease [Streptomyces sp. NHF165]GEB52747.1 ABC transporter permease [Streptomyces cacaoi]